MRHILKHLGIRGACMYCYADHLYRGHVHNRPDLAFTGKTLIEAMAHFRRLVDQYKGDQ